MFFPLVVLTLVFVLLLSTCTSPLVDVRADLSTDYRTCYNFPIPGLQQACINFSLDTCGDVGLSGYFQYGNTQTNFNITNAADLNSCISLSPLCSNVCLTVDHDTFKLTHSFAQFAPLLVVTCPTGTYRYPDPVTSYRLGVDCDAGFNTTCSTCTALSDRGTCAWCPTTRSCVATSTISTSLCDGVSTCPVDVLHQGMCPTDPPTPTPVFPTVPNDADVTCRNPMFTGNLSILQLTGLGKVTRPPHSLHLLSRPSIVEGASCPDLAGKPSCCDKDTFTEWKTTMSQFDELAKVAAKDKGDLSLDQLIDALTSTGYLPPFPPVLSPKQRELLNRLLVVFKKLDQPLQECAKKLVAYWNGLMCFACHPDWSTYYDPLTQKLRLSVDTCDTAANGCVPVLNILNSEKKDILEIITQLYDESGDRTYAQLNAALKIALNDIILLNSLHQDINICNFGWKRSCKDVVCTQFMHGLDYNFTAPSINIPTLLGAHRSHVMAAAGPGTDTDTGTGTGTGAGDASVSVTADADAWRYHLDRWIHPFQHTDRTKRATTLIQFIITWAQQQAQTQAQTQTQTLIQQIGQITTLNQLGDEQPPTGGHAINVYTPGGFPVYDVGCAAQFSKQACPPPSPPSPPSNAPASASEGGKSNTGLIIGILVGIALGLIALVALFWYCHKRRTTRAPPHRRLQDEDYLGGVNSPVDNSAYSRFDPRL